jgi:acyl-CoA thioester hydrolase
LSGDNWDSTGILFTFKPGKNKGFKYIFELRSMYNHDFKIRIRYGDTDQMGVVYYGNYPRFYEIGRMEMLRSLGLSYVRWEEEYGIIMPVVSMESRYLYPAKYDDELRIKTTLTEMPSKMISFDHKIFNERGILVNKGNVKLFFLQKETNKRLSAPEELTKKLAPYFE